MNIAEAVRIFRVLPEGTGPARRATRQIPRSYRRGGALSFAGLAIVVVTLVLVQHLSLKPPRTHASIPPQEKPALPLPDVPSIAVLPFTNLSGDAQQEYFSDGTELGHGQDAQAEAAEFMRISPGFVFGNVNKDAAVDRRWESDLREAGLK